MSRYSDLVREARENSKSTVYSKKLVKDLMNAYVNEDVTSKRVVADGENGYSVVETHPSEDFRKGLKKLVSKTYGIDSKEADKLDSVDIPANVTDPMVEIAGDVYADYLSTNKSLKFPMKEADQASMQISLVRAPEKTTSTKKIVQTSPGVYESVPTGVGCSLG